MANEFTFGAATFGNNNTFRNGGQKRETGYGISRAPSVVPEDLDRKEQKVYRRRYKEIYNDGLKNDDEAAVGAEDALFSFRDERRNKVANAAIKPDKLIGGWNLNGQAGTKPTLNPELIEDPGDAEVYRKAYMDTYRAEENNAVMAPNAAMDAAALSGEYALKVKYGYANPKTVTSSDYASGVLRGIDELEKYQQEQAAQQPANQGPADAAFAAAMQERLEREQRDRDDAATGAGARVQQIVAEKELERSLADGSIRDANLRAQAESDLAMLRQNNQEGRIYNQDGMAGLWSTIEAIRNQPADVNGNVDVSNRKRIPGQTMRAAGYDFDDGSYATLYSSTINGNGKTVLATPIDADGNVYSQEDLENYVHLLLDSTGSVEDLINRDKIENGGRGLIISGVNGERKNNIDALNRLGERLHEEEAAKGPGFTFSAEGPKVGSEAERFLKTLEQAGGVEALEDETTKREIGNVYAALTDPNSLRKYSDQDISYYTGLLESEIADSAHYDELQKAYEAGETNLTPEQAMQQERAEWDQQRADEERKQNILNALKIGYGLTAAGNYITNIPERWKDLKTLGQNFWANFSKATTDIWSFIGKTISGEHLYNLAGQPEWLRPAWKTEKLGIIESDRAYSNEQLGIAQAMNKDMVERAKAEILPVAEELGIDKGAAEYALSLGANVLQGTTANIGGQTWDFLVGFMSGPLALTSGIRDIAASGAANITALNGGSGFLGNLWNGLKTAFSGPTSAILYANAYENDIQELAAEKGGIDKLTTGDYWFGATDAFLNTAVEIGGGEDTGGLESLYSGKKNGDRLLKRLLSTSLEEPLEEVGQGEGKKSLQTLFEAAAGKEITYKKPISLHDENALINVAETGDLILQTALQSFGMGIFYEGANGLRNIVNKARTGIALNKQEQKLYNGMSDVAEQTAAQAETDQQHDTFQTEVNGENRGNDMTAGNVDPVAQAEVRKESPGEERPVLETDAPIRNEEAADSNRLDQQDTDVRAAELRMREAQAAETQAIIASGNQNVQAEERARLEQEAREAIARRQAAEAEYRRAQAEASAAMNNQNEQVNTRQQQEQQAKDALLEEAAKKELRLRRAQEALERAEAAANQQGQQAKERKEAEKRAGIARRQLRRAQEAYNEAMKAVEDQDRQADERKAAEEAARNDIRQRNDLLQSELDQTNRNAQDVIFDQDRQATERAQLEQDARTAEMRLREAQAAETQAIIASGDQSVQAEERARREQEARDAIARRQAAEEEYRRAQEAANAAVQDQKEQVTERQEQEQKAEEQIEQDQRNDEARNQAAREAAEQAAQAQEDQAAARGEAEDQARQNLRNAEARNQAAWVAADQEAQAQEDQAAARGEAEDQAKQNQRNAEARTQAGREAAEQAAQAQTNQATMRKEAEKTAEDNTEVEAQAATQAQEEPAGIETEQQTEQPAGEVPSQQTTQETDQQPAQETAQQPAQETEQEQERRRTADDINRRYGFNQRKTEGDKTKYQPGLTVNTWDGDVNEQTRTELQVIHEYAREHGFAVVMDSTIRPGGVRGVVNGFYSRSEDGGLVIHLAQDGKAPLRTTLGHELYHLISNLNRNGAQRIEKLYRDFAGRQGVDIEDLVTKKLEAYRNMGVIEADDNSARARAMALEEVIADGMYDVIGDERTLRVLAMEDRGTAERIRDWAERVLRDIRRMIDKYGANKAEARVLQDQADAMENMRAAIERALAETKELQDAKKAAKSLGSNSEMMNDWHRAMDAATTREEMNAATQALAVEVLAKGGIDQKMDNVRTLLTASLEYASGGGVISQVLNEYGMNTWIPSEEANRAFVSMGRYMKQMLESQDEAGYAQLMGWEPEGEIERNLSATRKEKTISNANGEGLAGIDKNGTAVKYSLESWKNTDKEQVRKDLLDAGYNETEVDKWIDDVNSVAKIIADNRNQLDYEADQEMHFVKPNAEYTITLDASTLCAKRRLYQGIFDQIQKQLPNTALQPGDLTDMINMMNEKGLETPCSFCYVESRRKWLGPYAKRFLKKYNGEYIPTMAELTSTSGLAKLRREHRQAYDDYIADMNRKGVANPKVVQPRTDYRNRELLTSLTKGEVQKLLHEGGVRVQSFSDFETVHLIDMMQVVLDMSSMGLTSQAYTKVPNFAWVFGDTGIKINLSLVGKGTGLDANGKLVFDDKEGMNFKEAMRLRDRYPKNVGTILVGINDAHILAAMADDRIDFIIPFHKSGWKKTDLKLNPIVQNYDLKYQELQNERYFVRDEKGNFVKTQNGRYKSTRVAKGNLYPSDYWDYSKTGKENAERYLQLCAEQGKLPKFYNFLVDNQDGSFSLQPDGSTDGYWKLLIDFKMYDNDGVGAPQTKVVPNVNMAEARRVLNEYDGNPNELPYDQDVVDRFVKQYKDKHRNVRYSVSADTDQEYQQAVSSGNVEEQQRLVDQAAKDAGYTHHMYHGTGSFGFTKFDLHMGENLIFATSDRRTAETYSGETQRSKISERSTINVDSLHGEELLSEAKKYLEEYKNLQLMTQEQKEQEAAKARDELNKCVSRAKEFAVDHNGMMNKEKENIFQRMIHAIETLSEAKTDEEMDKAWSEYDSATWDLKWMDEDFSYELMDAIGNRALLEAKNKLSDFIYNGDIYTEGPGKNYIFDQQLAVELNGALHRGVYELYGKHDKELVIDCNGENWNQIITPEELNLQGPQKTRDIAAAAKANGYKSVVLKNVRDNSDGTDFRGASDVYIYFDANQVKSADPVTYDDAGKMIPLSKRFNDKNQDIRWSAETEENGDDRTRYAVDADDARDMTDLGSDIARTSNVGWQLIDTLRQMKMRQTQDADGNVQRTAGYWKKQTAEIAKSLTEFTFGKDQKTIEKAVRELFTDLDEYEGDARGFVDYALRQAQGTMRDLYTDETENPTRENLKAFFEKYGPLYITPEQKKELQFYAGGMTAFRRQAAGLVPITNKKSAIGLEEVWEELAPLIGKDPSIVSVGTMIMEFNDAVEKARSVNGEERTLTDEEMAVLDRRALDLVAEYMEAGATVVPTRTVEKIDADRHQQALREVSRLQEETDRQQEEIGRLTRRLEDADNVNQSLNRQLFSRAAELDELKKSNATRAEIDQARTAYREAAAQAEEAVKAMKDLQKKLEAARTKRDEYRSQLRQANRAEQQYEKAQHQIERLKAGRENLKKQIEQMKLKAMDARLINRQTKERNQHLNNIRKTGGALRAMFSSPSEKKGYIPMDQVRVAADLVESLVDADKGGNAAKMSKRLENALRDARESTDYQTSTMYDEALYRDMQDVTRLLEDKGSLRNLSGSELAFVDGTLTSIVYQIKTSNETVGRQKNQAIQEEAEDAVKVMRENPKDLNGLGRMIRKGMLTHLNPQRFYAILGHHGNNAWTRMGEEQSEGQRKANMLTMNMTKTFEGLTQGENEKKFDKFTGKNATWYDTGIQILTETGQDSGRTWKMNGAMRAFFGLSWQSEENREAMRAVGEKGDGGKTLYQLTIPDEELMKRGKEKEAYARGERVYFTAEQAEQIVDDLTDYEKAWMNAWKNMEKLSKNAINETSLQLNGFRKANVNNYVPIFRDPRYIGKEFESVVTDARLTSMGFLKERVNAHNPMMLMDLTNVINRQVRDVSAYYGFAIPTRNATRIYNGKMPGNATSVKEVINKTQGMEYGQYFEKLMSDLQGGSRVESSFLDRLRGNVAGATLSGNPSVIIKQAASYPAAASVLGWGPLMKGMKYFNPAGLKKINVDEIDQYTSALWERRSRSLSDLEANANRNTAMSKFLHKMTNGIQGMDIATTKVIWKAAEYYVDEHSPDLKRGTEEYKNAVARIYEQALEQTQPEYGTMQRPQILRSTSQIVKSLTMYKTQSLQNFGILVDAAYNLSDKAKAAKANNSTENQAALKEAKTQMATAISSQITSAVILGVMTALGRALLHKMGGYRDDKGDLTAESVGGQILKDSVSSVAGMVVGGTEAFDLINGLIEGQSPFDIEAAGVSTINDLYQNLFGFGEAMKVIGDKELTNEQKMNQVWPKLRKMGLSVTQLLGLPVGNFLNLLDGIAANAADFATGKAGTFASKSPLQIAGTALIGSAQGRETSNKAVAGYIAQAMMDGNQAEAVRLYNEQLRQGKTADALNTAIATWQKENIPEIRQAAEAIEAGDISEYNRLINQLTEMGLSMTNAVKYVEAARKKGEGRKEEVGGNNTPMTYEEIVSGMTKATNTSEENVYTNGMMNSLLEDGNVAAAMAVRDDMIKNGNKKLSAINSSLTSFWKPRIQEAYANGDMEEVRRITNMLVQMGMKRTTITGWTSNTKSTSSSSSKKSGFGSGTFGSGSFGSSSKKSSSKKKSGFGSGSFGSGSFGR